MKQYYFSKSRRSTCAGFTIIELLVAVGITAMLVTLMLTIVTNVLNGWNRSAGSLSSGNQARTILTQLSQDLQSLVVRQDGNVWLAANIQPDQTTQKGDAQVQNEDWTATNIKPKATDGSVKTLFYVKATTANTLTTVPDLSEYRFGQAGVWLRFFTTPQGSNTSDLATISAPRAVSYQIIRRKVGGEYRYQLFRAEVRPGPKSDGSTPGNSTFDVGYDLSSTSGTINYNMGDDAVAGNAGNIRRPLLSQLLANNVIDFGIRVWVKNAATGNLDVVFPNSASASSTSPAYIGFSATQKSVTTAPSSSAEDTTTAFSSFPPGTPYVAGFPSIIEVSVRVLTDEGARVINNFESGSIQAPVGLTPAAYWWQIADANSNVYTRRIEIKSREF